MTKKLTLNIPDQQGERLAEISGELGVTTTELIRRAIGLVSIVHELNSDGSDSFVCKKIDGQFVQQHILDTISF